MSKKDLRKKRRNNRKLYPIYSSIGLDYMFYYGIKVLFLSQVKNITNAEIVLATSFFALFSIITQIPINIIIHNLGKRRALILANSLNALSMLLIIICPNFTFFIFEELISSIATGIKSITEASILDLSIPKFNKKGEFYTKMKRNGYSKYCYMYAASTLIAGILYNINPYIPIVLSMGVCILATVVSTEFIEIKVKADTINEEPYLKQLKDSFKFIFKSNRLRALLISVGLIWGLICLYDTYQVILLKELNVPAMQIGFILALLQIVKGKISKYSGKMNTKFKNKTLTIMSSIITLCFFLAGAIAIFNIDIILIVEIIVLSGILVAGIEGIYHIIKSKYLNNFANSKILTKIYSANTIINNLLRMIIGFIGSLILSQFNIKYTMIIIGISFTAVVYLLYLYMKPKLGLKPDQYKIEDIKIK